MSRVGAIFPMASAALALGILGAMGARATEPPPGAPPGIVPPPSIHQTEWLSHAGQPLPEPAYPFHYTVAPEAREESVPSPSALTRTVYGFLPNWVATNLSHIQWNLLSHISYFSVTLNSDGSVTNLSGSYAWPSGTYAAAVRNTAHANGVKVTLAATNFTPSSITTLLSSSTNRQNAINNLKALVQGYGEGVNIDLEGVPASQKANLVTFMTDLTAAFHSAIPGSHVTLDTPAVDWSGAFDYDQLALNSDGMFIMGYDYWWSGSSTAGPCSPLTSGGVWGTYNVTWTVNDYLTYGGAANRSKFILGLPYYGREWPTSSTSVPSSTTGSASTLLYNAARTNATTYGRLWDGASQTPYYVYTSGGAHQGWYDDAESLGYKWDLVNTKDLGGTGMWALNYDTNDDLLWNQIQAKFATSAGSLSGVKIGIDPGHGGTDPGAVGPTGLQEKDVNLSTSVLLRDALVAQGATCYLTRTGDSTVSLTARTDYFNSIPVDRAESCHYNASGTASANYTGVHIYDDGTNTCTASATSKDMATKAAARLDTALGIGVVSCNCPTFMRGVHGDNFHMVRETAMPAMLTEASFISNPTEEGLLKTDARKCTIAGAIAKGIEDHYGATAAEPPCAGPVQGTCANPIEILTFPYTNANTTSGKPAGLNGYSCPPASGSEAGPEVIYTFTVRQPGNLTVTVTDGSTVDIDPHLLSACSPSACLARNDTTFTIAIQPGTYFIACDTWTSSGGTQYPGAYTLNVAFASTAGDTTAPAVPQDFKWNRNSARWQWSAPALDRLGNPETMGYYQIWRATSLAGTYTLLADSISALYYADPSLPTPGACYFYQLHAVDAAGNRDNPHVDWIVDNPQASFAGIWSTGNTTAGHWGDDYRFVSTGGTGTKTATWSFGVDETGLYDISVYYPSGSNRSTASRFTATYFGGSKLFTVNQQQAGGTWTLLGSHWLVARQTYTVVLDDSEPAGFVILADAVRWTKVP